MSNLLWLEKPGKSEKQTIKLQVVANIMQLTEMSQTIFRKFVHELKILLEQDKITAETLANFKHNMVIHQLLKDKTFNDSTMFTGQTTQEIIQDYKDEVIAPYQELIEQGLRDRDKLAEELEREKEEKDKANGKKESPRNTRSMESALVISSIKKQEKFPMLYTGYSWDNLWFAIISIHENLKSWSWISGLLTILH